MISALTKMLATCVHAAKDTSCVPVLKGFGIAWNQALMVRRGIREAYVDVRNGHHLSPVYRLLLLRMKLRWAWLACDQLTLARLGGLASRKLCRSGWSP